MVFTTKIINAFIVSKQQFDNKFAKEGEDKLSLVFDLAYKDENNRGKIQRVYVSQKVYDDYSEREIIENVDIEMRLTEYNGKKFDKYYLLD